MIKRDIIWFIKEAEKIWKSEPAKSILTIVPKGYDEEQVSEKIADYMQESFAVHTGDESNDYVIIPISPDSNANAEQLVQRVVRLIEKHIGPLAIKHLINS